MQGTLVALQDSQGVQRASSHSCLFCEGYGFLERLASIVNSAQECKSWCPAD